jgi:hypothetical protein
LDLGTVSPPCCVTTLIHRNTRLVPIEEVEERDPCITTVGQRASRRRDRRVDPYPNRMAAGDKQERFHRYLKVFGDSFVSDSELRRRQRDFDFLDRGVESCTDLGGDRSCTPDHGHCHYSLPRHRAFLVRPHPSIGQSRQCGQLDWPVSGRLWAGASDATGDRGSFIG